MKIVGDRCDEVLYQWRGSSMRLVTGRLEGVLRPIEKGPLPELMERQIE